MTAELTDRGVKKDLVKKQGCFSQLTDEEIGNLSDLLIEKKVTAGETIVTEGELVDTIFLIVSGTADVQIRIVKNNAIQVTSVATLGPGESIGLNETGFYSVSGKRTATVVALTDMVLLRLRIAEFHGFALANSHVSEVMRKNAEAVMNIK